MNISICFVNDFFLKDENVVTTGPGVQIYLISKALAQRGWNVYHIVATKNTDKVGTVEDHEGMSMHYLAHRPYEVFAVPSLFQKCREIAPDIFYQRGRAAMTGVVAFAARQLGKKFVWSSAGEGGVARKKYTREQLSKHSGLRRVLLYPYFGLLDRICEYGIERADFVFAQTAHQLALLSKEFGRGGIIFGSGHPIPDGGFDDKPEPPVVLWVGALKKVKQPELFLKLVATLAAEKARFVMIGSLLDQCYQGLLSNLQKRYENFSYQGEVPFDVMPQWFARAAVMVNTTKKDYEGLPNAFIQAWLHGVPVVSLYSDPDDAIKTNAIGYQTNDFDDLVEKIKILIRDTELRRDMGRRARSYAVREFGIEALVDRFVEIVTGAPT